jgi:hypothetical protein
MAGDRRTADQRVHRIVTNRRSCSQAGRTDHGDLDHPTSNLAPAQGRQVPAQAFARPGTGEVVVQAHRADRSCQRRARDAYLAERARGQRGTHRSTGD